MQLDPIRQEIFSDITCVAVFKQNKTKYGNGSLQSYCGAYFLIYGSECWQLSKKHKQIILTVEMDFQRRACRISRLDCVQNDEIR